MAARQPLDAYGVLLSHGPSTTSELGVTSIGTETRRDNPELGRLHLRARGMNSPKTVWYVEDRHDPRDVVRKYVDVNPGVLDRPHRAVVQLFGDHSDTLAWAWGEVADEYDVERREREHGETEHGGTCSMCGEDYDYTLPDHLANECGRDECPACGEPYDGSLPDHIRNDCEQQGL